MADTNVNGRASHFSGLAIKPRTATSAAITVSDKDAGKSFITDVATAQTFTLPAATGTGDVFKFVIGVTATADKVIQVANSTDEFLGTLVNCDTDTGDALVGFNAAPADNFDTVTLNGTTTGGLGGDIITITDIASGVFLIEGLVNGNGAVATPFSSAV